MRTGFALVLAIVLGACGSDGTGGDDDTTPPDSPPVDPPDLVITSPEIEILPGQEITYCWYFRTTNAKPLAIKRWESTMTSGSHHLIMFTTMSDVQPPGKVSASNCGAGTSLASYPIWTYASQTTDGSLDMPADDGEGKPVALEIAANQAGFLQMHYINRGDASIMAQATVTGYALDEGTAYTKTAAYVTFNDKISIPAMTTGDIEAQTCNVSMASKFWLVTTHAHKQAVRTAVKDGMPMTGTTVFESTDWEHPGETRWNAPFYSFGTGRLTYECEYNNPTNRTITAGDSAQSDEMCMAAGYFFPATRPVFCYNSSSTQL
jgi:hypothetical protein